MAEAKFAEANELMIEEDYDSALDLYDAAIEEDPQARFLVKRAACNMKLGNHLDALSDANKALEADASSAIAYLRKGAALFAMEEYVSAKNAFEAGAALDGGNRQFKTWLRKCNAEIEAEGGAVVASGTTTTTTTTSTTTTSSNAPAVASTDTPAPTPATATAEAATPPQTPAPAASGIRHEWYQNASTVVVTIYAKKTKAEDLVVEFQADSLKISLTCPGGAFDLETDLCGEIDPEASSFKIKSTKVEVRLVKAAEAHWRQLEAGSGDDDLMPVQTADEANKHAYPSSSRKVVDWNKLEQEGKEIEDEEKDPLNKLFQQIFTGGNEETRRAMNKSFVESNGTVLSTNWSEVGTGTVEGSAPKGMEMHDWNERNSEEP